MVFSGEPFESPLPLAFEAPLVSPLPLGLDSLPLPLDSVSPLPQLKAHLGNLLFVWGYFNAS